MDRQYTDCILINFLCLFVFIVDEETTNVRLDCVAGVWIAR